MNKIIEFRAQEQMCRQRAVFDQQHRHYWLGQAEMWWHKAQDELSGGRIVGAGSVSAVANDLKRRGDTIKTRA